MKMQIEIDKEILDEAMKLGNTIQKATIEAAIKEYIARKKRIEIKRTFGSIEYDPEYDYKQLRQAR
ncbi:MAG: type II toxin-antitoxin system VapB family antitoxin [Ignavibacteriales bacterium]|nr:type II toxin-antitoxin system VapB family antitoxin [Ignavibacteriales bacterium]